MVCYAHIIHNSIQCASDGFPFDVESIVCNIFSFFHINTVRIENLTEFCDFADVQYKDLLSHSKGGFFFFLLLNASYQSLMV
jgi:hypothetical protein